MTDADDDPRYGQAPPRRYYGKYPATVSSNDPPADGKAHRGQIQVQVPGILEETSDGESQQALQVIAAPAFLPGFFFVPEVDDPVWVEFIAGDINFPIWTGVWYPDDTEKVLTIDATKPTDAGPAPTRDQKIIRTPSGQVIQLDDTDQAEQTVIKDETNGNIVTFTSTGITVWATASGGNVTLQFGGDENNPPTATVVIEDKKITVAANKKQTLVLDDGGSKTTITDDTNKNTVTLDSNGITFTDNNQNQITFASGGLTLSCGSSTSIALTSSDITLKAANVKVSVSGTMDVGS